MQPIDPSIAICFLSAGALIGAILTLMILRPNPTDDE